MAQPVNWGKSAFTVETQITSDYCITILDMYKLPGLNDQLELIIKTRDRTALSRYLKTVSTKIPIDHTGLVCRGAAM